MSPKPRLSLLWLLLLTLLPLVPGDSPASNPDVPGAPRWIPWEAVKLPSITLVRSHSSPPGIAIGQQFKAYCNFVDGSYRPGYLLGDPKPALVPWKWIPGMTGHTSLATAATATATQTGQRVWVEAGGEYAWPPDSVDSTGQPVTSGPRTPVRFAQWVDMGVTQTFTDANADGISDDWARHYGLKSANDLFLAMESGTPVSSFGDFTAGFISSGTFTACTSQQHVKDYYQLGVHGFTYQNWIPCVLQNCTESPVSVGCQLNLAPRQFRLLPGTAQNVKAALRFTAPSAGRYRYACVFQALNPGLGDGVRVTVSKSGSALQTGFVGPGFASSIPWSGSVSLSAGEVIDFAVDNISDYNYDSVGLFLTVTKEDADGDGLTDLLEFKNSTDPNVADTDGDGVGDNIEVLAGLNPLDAKDVATDWDGDGVPNGVEAVLRMEAAAINPPDSWAWLVPQLQQLDPATSRDSDADGVPDDYETVFGLPTAVPVAVFSAGENMTAKENSGTPANTFGPFQTGMGSGSGFTAFTQHTGANGLYDGHASLQGFTKTGADTFPAVVVNRSAIPIRPWYIDESRPLAAHQLLLHPHHSGPDATLRFTAPAAGQYSFCARFDALNSQVNGVDVFVRQGSGSTLLFSKKIGGVYQRAATTASVRTLAAGETLDFSVGPNGVRDGDSTAVTITCFQLQPAADGSGSVTYDANSTFRQSERGVSLNPFGLFQAGYNSGGSGFTAFTQAQHTAFDGYYKYKGFSVTPQGYPLVYVNPSATTAITGAPFSAAALPGQIVLHPGSGEAKAILRFIAPEGGNYSFSANFQRLVTEATTATAHSVEASVLKGPNQASVKSATIGTGTPNPQSALLEGSCSLVAGETLDFAVGPDGDSSYDATGLTLKVTRSPGNADSDGDGLPDRAEAQARTWATTPASWRYPVTGFPLGYSTTDENLNGIPDIFEPPYDFAASGYVPESGSAPASFQMPNPRDTDSDGAWDGQEVISGSDPLHFPEEELFPPVDESGGGNPPFTSSGAPVDSSFFGSAYPGADQSAFSWFQFVFGRQELQATSDQMASSSDFTHSSLKDSKWYAQNYDYDAQSWKEPFSIFENSTFGGMGKEYSFIKWKARLSDRDYINTKVKVIGGYQGKKIIIDKHHDYQGWDPTQTHKVNDGIPYRILDKTTYSARTFLRKGWPETSMAPWGNLRELEINTEIDSVTGLPYYEYSFASHCSTASEGEFYLGNNDSRWQYLAERNGVQMTPNTPNNEGAWIKLYVPDFLLDAITFNFDLGLKVESANGLEIKSGVETWGVGSYITVRTTDNTALGDGLTRNFTISVSGRKNGSLFQKAIYAGGTPWESGNILVEETVPCVIKGPTLQLVQKGQSPKGKAWSLNLSEDGGSRFRKISLEGLPLADGKPQTEAESDSRADDTYVDALNLNLSHHTSDIHVPIGSSDLALSVDRNLCQEAWNNRSGSMAPSVNDADDEDGFVGKPFGSCWTTSLVPHIVLEVDDNAVNPPMATVVDEAGSTFRFAYCRQISGDNSTPLGFLPLPSPSDQTSLMNRLNIVGTSTMNRLDLVKRFGTVTHYEFAASTSNAAERRTRIYYRIRPNGSSTLGTVPGVEDRFGNKLYYYYSQEAATISTAPETVAALLIPDSITDRSAGGRRLVITAGDKTTIPDPDARVGQRFIQKVSLVEGTTSLQETSYLYRATTLSDLEGLRRNDSTWQSSRKTVLLSEVRRKTGGGGNDYISQFFDYNLTYDPDVVENGKIHAHLWLSKMKDGAGRYHRFETVFDRSRKYYHSPSTTQNLRVIFQQGLDRPLSAVYFSPGNGTEQLLSEFKLQQPPKGEQAGYIVDNGYARNGVTDAQVPETAPVVTGKRINAVVDADRRIRYYRFTAPAVRDTKAFQNFFFSNPSSPDLQRTVLISWTQMEIDHTGGALERYIFDPAAMMALKSSQMDLPGGYSARTDWEYTSPFKASQVCSFLSGRTYGNNIPIDQHPFFASFYPDPTSEIRLLVTPAGYTAPSAFVPLSGSSDPNLPVPPNAQMVKTFTYWADTKPAASKPWEKPWARTMVESSSGFRAGFSGELLSAVRTATTLNDLTGLPMEERVFAAGNNSTEPNKTTLMSYGTPPNSSFTAPPSFRWKTEILQGVSENQSLITTSYPDAYGYVAKTVTGDGTSGGSTVHCTQRNALGQILAEFDGEADPAGLSTNTGATRFTYRMDGRLIKAVYPLPSTSSGGTTVFPAQSAAEDAKTCGYDSTGRKIWEQQPDGSATVYNYDDRGRIWRTYQRLNFNSTAADAFDAATDPATVSTFSPSGLLLTQTAPSGLVTSYQYDWLRRVVSQESRDTGPGGTTATTKFSYEGAYCGDSLFSASSFKPTKTVGPSLLSNGLPATTVTWYNSLFQKIREEREYEPGTSAISQWAYNAQGLVVMALDPNARLTFTTYDGLGHVYEVWGQGATGRTTTLTTPAGLAYSTTRLIPSVTPIGATAPVQPSRTRTTITEYDAAGRAKVIYLPHPATGDSEYSAEAAAAAESTAAYAAAHPGDAAAQTAAASAAGAVAATRGQEFTYDTAGRKLTVTTRQSAAGAIPVVKTTTTTAYDARGRVWKVTSPAVLDCGNQMPPPAGTALTAPVTESKYDSMNRQTWAYANWGAAPVPAGTSFADSTAGRSPGVSLTVYDKAGRVIRTLSPVVATASAASLSAGTPDYVRLVTLTAYDPLTGSPVRVKTGQTLANATDTGAYTASIPGTALPYPASTTAPGLGETVNRYNQRGQLLSSSRYADATASGIITESFLHDATGNRTQVTDGNGRLTRFTHDGFGRVTQTIHNAGAAGAEDKVTNTYDGVMLTSTTDANGQKISFLYDYLYHLSRVAPYGPSPDKPLEYHYHDATGERVAVRHFRNSNTGVAANALTWKDTDAVYDCLGRLKYETSAGLKHSYEYDTAGNRTKVTYADGTANARVLTSRYDALNRLTSCTEGTRTTNYYYDLRGNTRRRTLANSTFEEKTFDLAGRMLTQKTAKTSGSTVTDIATTATQYDAFGNVRQQTENRPAAGTLAAASRTVTNTYDGISRLTQESIAQSGTTTATSWTYDPAGNRTSQSSYTNGALDSSNAYRHTADYDAANAYHMPPLTGEAEAYRPNQLRSTGLAAGVPGTFYRYDRNGNRTRKWNRLAGRLTTYTWDSRNRLIKVTLCSSASSVMPADPLDLKTWEYSYDTRSRRILRTQTEGAGTSLTTIAAELESFSGGTSASRWRNSGTMAAPVRGSLVVETIRGSDFGGGVGGVLHTIEPPATSGGAETPRFYEYGARGDVTGHSNTTGTPIFRAVYKAFGDHTDSGTPGPNRQRASTKDEETTLGLLNEGFRYRDITTGTFLSRDPAGFVDGPNLYSYVSQNPWSKFDPEGLMEMTWFDAFVLNHVEDIRTAQAVASVGLASVQAAFSTAYGSASYSAVVAGEARTAGINVARQSFEKGEITQEQLAAISANIRNSPVPFAGMAQGAAAQSRQMVAANAQRQVDAAVAANQAAAKGANTDQPGGQPASIIVVEAVDAATSSSAAGGAAGGGDPEKPNKKEEEEATKYPKDYATKDTKNWSATVKSEGEARAFARTKLGSKPVEVEPNKWRSADGKWQYRAKPGDLKDNHLHLEELNPKTGEVLQNLHLRW